MFCQWLVRARHHHVLDHTHLQGAIAAIQRQGYVDPSLLKPNSLIYCDGLFTILAMRRELRLQNAGILSIAAG